MAFKGGTEITGKGPSNFHARGKMGHLAGKNPGKKVLLLHLGKKIED